MKFSNYLNNVIGKLYSKDDIKILDIDGHLRDLDELCALDRTDIICMVFVKGCSTEDLNTFCDKVSRLDDRIPLVAVLESIYGDPLKYDHLPRLVSGLIDVLDERYELLPEVRNLTKLGEYVFSNNLWDTEKYKGKRTCINFKKIGQDFVNAGKAIRTRYGYLLRFASF